MTAFSAFHVNGVPFQPTSVSEAIPADHVRVIPDTQTVAWYDYDGLWYEPETEAAVETRIAEIVEQSVGYPVRLKAISDGNGHISWSFERVGCEEETR